MFVGEIVKSQLNRKENPSLSNEIIMFNVECVFAHKIRFTKTLKITLHQTNT